MWEVSWEYMNFSENDEINENDYLLMNWWCFGRRPLSNSNSWSRKYKAKVNILKFCLVWLHEFDLIEFIGIRTKKFMYLHFVKSIPIPIPGS